MSDEKRVSISRSLRRGAGESVFLHEGHADDARKHEEEYWPDFQKCAKQRAEPRVPFVFRRQHPLNDGLITAPVPNAKHRIAEQNGIPGQPGRIAGSARHIQEITCAPGDLALGYGPEWMWICRERAREFTPAAN